ncbi:hypothetical protein PR001_g17133 [Phytophthora rubi]|uniref:Uncharacterized protein n=1 Tax=Phytophthora rubi TaxID=129364 RepID=A0A6A3KSE9_9STRA|nr:hypothetical protein PR002_g17089 [Phytophthora rubi]KAE9006753.1 hypothetical protein PR001_g17133 [Phytophthora rubi]
MSEHDRVPVMEQFKQSGSTKRLNTQSSLPMLAVGGKKCSQDVLLWEGALDPSGDYVQDVQADTPSSSDVEDSKGSSTIGKLKYFVCCCRRS